VHGGYFLFLSPQFKTSTIGNESGGWLEFSSHNNFTSPRGSIASLLTDGRLLVASTLASYREKFHWNYCSMASTQERKKRWTVHTSLVSIPFPV